MNKRYVVITNDSRDTREKVYETDDRDDAIRQCDITAYHNKCHMFTVLDMQPIDYRYDIYYAECSHNFYFSFDNELWEKIPHEELKYHFK